MGSDRAPASGPLELALVIPAYNEQNRLPRTLDRLAEMSRDSGLCIHVLVVDDGSEDGTAACVLAR
ncbi:MAG: glycosyltransferase, partial [Actinomycetota bacterium]|nr:glycosyltransferase [Actinomycetota bacterium]